MAFMPPAPWRPIADAPKKGQLCLLLVDYSGEDAAHPLDDELTGRTLGHNNDDNEGPGEGEGWKYAGWCWSHDHYVQGRGVPVAFILLDDVAPEVTP